MLYIILCKGHPCTGKSTITAHLASILHWTVCDKDDAKDQLQALVQQDSTLSDAHINAVSYSVMFSVAATQLKCGNSVIIDSPCARRAVFDRAYDLAQQVCDNVYIVLYVSSPPHLTTPVQCTPRTPHHHTTPVHCTPHTPHHHTTPPQYNAHLLLLDIHTSDPCVWRTRLQERVGQQQTHQSHKPQTWEALQALVQGYGDAPGWSTVIGTAWSTLEGDVGGDAPLLWGNTAVSGGKTSLLVGDAVGGRAQHAGGRAQQGEHSMQVVQDTASTRYTGAPRVCRCILDTSVGNVQQWVAPVLSMLEGFQGGSGGM